MTHVIIPGMYCLFNYGRPEFCVLPRVSHIPFEEFVFLSVVRMSGYVVLLDLFRIV